jgi:drug/metabolite transporter (DMT)-like permease
VTVSSRSRPPAEEATGKPRAKPDTSAVVLLLVPFIWGATFPAGKQALESLTPPTFTAWSRGLGFGVLVLALPWFGRDLPRDWIARTWLPGLVLGALLFAGFTLQTLGLDLSTATNAGFITGLYVVFTPLLGLLLFKEATSRAAWVAVFLSVAGLALLSTTSLRSFEPRAGDILVFLSAIAWAGHVVALGRFAVRYPARGLAVAQMGAAAFLHVLAASPDGFEPAAAASVWPLLAITGIFGSGIAFTLQAMAQQEIGPTRAAVILAGESLVAAALSAIWLGERLTPHQWAGAAFVLAAMMLSELKARSREGPQLEPGSAA